MRISGIYKIQSVIKPERIYIGSAIYIKSRWAMHLYQLRNNKHGSQKLQRHYNKYGESDLQFSILSGCEKERLIEQEQYFIDAYKPYFNNRIIAASNNLGLRNRWHHSEETKRKFSNILKGNKRTLGFKHSIETRRKISEALRLRVRKPMTDETKHKLSLANKGNKTGWDINILKRHYK
jgi:group I intron endonuclease